MRVINNSSCSSIDRLHAATQNTAENILRRIVRTRKISCLFVRGKKQAPGIQSYQNESNQAKFGHSEGLSVAIAISVCGCR